MLPRTAVAFTVVLLIAPPTAVPARADVDAPQWSPGDSWTYDVVIAVDAGLVLNGTLQVAVTDVGPRSVKGISLTAFQTILSGGGEVRGGSNGITFQGRWSLAGEQWIEAARYKVVRSVSQIDANGTTQPFRIDFSFQVQNTTESVVTSDTWRYPIGVGTVGRLVTNTTSAETVRIRTGGNTTTTTSGATYDRIVTLQAVDSRTVRVPYGAVEALEIHVGWPTGEVDRWYFAAGLGNNARTESYDTAGERVAESSLRSVRYRAAEGPPSFLGLPPPVAYGLLASAVAAAVTTVVAVWRRRHRPQGIGRRTPPDFGRPPGAT